MSELGYMLLDRASPLGSEGDGKLLRTSFDVLDLKQHGGLALIDIGAAGDLPPRFKPVEPWLAYVGFEPDDRSRTELLSKRSDCLSYTIYGQAIGEAHGKVDLHLLEGAVFSSTFEPNRAVLNRYPGAGRFDIVEKVAMDTVPLDSLDLQHCDFIKADIQGGELAALVGASETLTGCFGLEVEVEFTKLYKDQPLFGQVHSFVSGQGFEFVDFLTLGRWSRDRDDRLGQCLYGDALFLRPPEQVMNNTPGERDIAAYLAILIIYRRYDLAQRAIDMLAAEHPIRKGPLIELVDKARGRQRRIAALHRASLRFTGGGTPGYRSHLFY